MNPDLQNINELLQRGIPGFHQYHLRGQLQRLVYVSQNLCDMLGVSSDALLKDGEDGYAARVYGEDRERYRAFLQRFSSDTQTATLQYRLVRGDGSILFVSDTVSVCRGEGETLVASSVLTDISEWKAKNNDLRFLIDTAPCGFLKYTCEKQPRIIYINDRMLSMLGFSMDREEDADLLQMYQDNVYLMIPAEERLRFSQYLKQVYAQSEPLAGEFAVLRCDGTKGYLFGWVAKCVNEDGTEEFQSVCMDVSQRHYKRKVSEMSRYLQALTDVYDMVFECNRQDRTVKCLYSKNSEFFKRIEQIPMQMGPAIEEWIENMVSEEDKPAVSDFFHTHFARKDELEYQPPSQIQYRARSSSVEMNTYRGIFLRFDEKISLFCCRYVPEAENAALLQQKNTSLQDLQEKVMRFMDGMASFEIIGGYITPLYASNNVSRFFGYTPEEWSALMKGKTPLREFVSRSSVTAQMVDALFESGEGVFTYFDELTRRHRTVKAICSQKVKDPDVPLYVMLYHMDGERKGLGNSERSSVFVRTFGYFDVFVEGRPIAFRSQKAKELFALMVDRRGGYVTSDEAISFLWPEEPANTVTLARYRKVALRLKNILEEYGISRVIEAVDGKRRIVPEEVQCDLYDYLSGGEEYAKLFKGSYLSNYSWGETTLGELNGGN